MNVEAVTERGCFELTVSNSGQPIPAATIKELFQPFFRGKVGSQGLGLGLYIAAEIARAHGGTLSVVSEERETRFKFSMPLDAGLSASASAGAHG